MPRPTANWAFARYEDLRAHLPKAAFPKTSQGVGGLVELADQFDVFLLDAFGVLNVGETAIASAPAAIAALQALDKQVLVLTNGATYPADQALAKYSRLGFEFQLNDVIASRDALATHLAGLEPRRWGVMAARTSQIEQLPVDCQLLLDDPKTYNAVDGFLLLSTTEWSAPQHALLTASLKARPRPVLVGNPDIVAPREDGLSLEPGHYAHSLSEELGITPQFFGKPFANIYELAFARLGEVDRARVLMVGDTLHTDILGGAAYGVKTALITDHGLFAGLDTGPYIATSGIVPDFIMGTP